MLVFHATGSGGRTMESLIDAGMIAGVLDITTTELADELCGGVMSARSRAVARRCAPRRTGRCRSRLPRHGQLLGTRDRPAQYRERRFYQHNPNVTLMRTNVEENRELGCRLAKRVNQSNGPVTVLLPLGGLSMIDAGGGPFGWPEADLALFDAIRENLRRDVAVVEMKENINDTAFAERAADGVIEAPAGRTGKLTMTMPTRTKILEKLRENCPRSADHRRRRRHRHQRKDVRLLPAST